MFVILSKKIKLAIVNDKLSSEDGLCAEIRTLGVRSISEGKNEDEIAERFDGDKELVKTWVDTLKQVQFIVTNCFDELVVTPDAKNYLEKYGDSIIAGYIPTPSI